MKGRRDKKASRQTFARFRGRLSERGVEHGLADLDASRSLANREALGDKRPRAPELFFGDDGFAPSLATARRRCTEAGTSSLADKSRSNCPSAPKM
jgi:hypothetical protein